MLNRADPLFESAFFSVHGPETEQTQNHLQDRGTRRRKSDMEHGRRHLAAHQEGDRDPDEERADNALDHDEARHAEAIVEADEAE